MAGSLSPGAPEGSWEPLSEPRGRCDFGAALHKVSSLLAGCSGALRRAGLLLQQVGDPLLPASIHRAINNGAGAGIQQVPVIN